MFWSTKSVKFHFRWGAKPRDQKYRRLGTIGTSIQDSKPHEKQISQSFSYCELINLLRNGTIVCRLWKNKKTSEKSVFREAWSPELTSQSFPVPCFWSRGFVPHQKWNLMLLVHQNTGKENRYGKNFFAVLISTLGRFANLLLISFSSFPWVLRKLINQSRDFVCLHGCYASLASTQLI